MQKHFLSIKETVEQLGLSEYYLRNGIRNGTIPFIKCGKKQLINIPLLIEQLDKESRQEVNA
jgi:excisionase family DNA binding protein